MKVAVTQKMLTQERLLYKTMNLTLDSVNHCSVPDLFKIFSLFLTKHNLETIKFEILKIMAQVWKLYLLDIYRFKDIDILLN